MAENRDRLRHVHAHDLHAARGLKLEFLEFRFWGTRQVAEQSVDQRAGGLGVDIADHAHIGGGRVQRGRHDRAQVVGGQRADAFNRPVGVAAIGRARKGRRAPDVAGHVARVGFALPETGDNLRLHPRQRRVVKARLGQGEAQKLDAVIQISAQHRRAHIERVAARTEAEPRRQFVAAAREGGGVQTASALIKHAGQQVDDAFLALGLDICAGLEPDLHRDDGNRALLDQPERDAAGTDGFDDIGGGAGLRGPEQNRGDEKDRGCDARAKNANEQGHPSDSSPPAARAASSGSVSLVLARSSSSSVGPSSIRRAITASISASRAYRSTPSTGAA